MREFQLTTDPETATADAQTASQILDALNEAQRSAVAATDGPALIVAGPGSGKTRVLTHKVAYLLASGKAQPWQILALTFTNKAAREMKRRIEDLAGDEARGIWMGTFHSIFARLLRAEADKIGYTADYSIYDSDDQERVLRGLMEQYNIDSRQFSARAMRSLISAAKTSMISPAEYARTASTLIQDKAAQLFQPYQETLRRSNALDFDDLLLKPLDLFRKAPETLDKYQSRWQYIYIDEYQDTNQAQYQLAQLLAARHRNICAVGDDSQSIYAFRGADITNILSFQRDYKDALVLRLEQNYRSTQKILRLADSIINHNEDRLEKSLWTENEEGHDVILMEAISERDEAQKIERHIRDLYVRGFRYREFAALYRTNAQSRSIEDALRRGGIPYRVFGGLSFYQRKEIKDVLAYLRLVVNPNDTASLRRVINYPTRGIGQKSIERIVDFAVAHDLTVWQAVDRVGEIGLGGRAVNAVERFASMISGFAERMESVPADELAGDVIRASGLLDELKREHTTENLIRWENVQELVSAVAEFVSNNPESGSLSTFLQEVSLVTDADLDTSSGDVVTLMTLHASKGLEYPVVFITGLEEGLFPLARMSEERKDLEEERRLFYVGVTRAEKRVFLSYARSRCRFGDQQSSIRSRFLDEVDDGLVRTEAGVEFKGRTDRFASRSSSRIEYDDVDPHYYRRNLRGDGGHESKKSSRTQADDRKVVYEEGEGGSIVPGVTVEHEVFGEGKVLALDGAGLQAKATVFFPEVGQKKLVLRFARLRLIE
jgi:DNA helicase-2/ATP-dependent DNA helicase PcrA